MKNTTIIAAMSAVCLFCPAKLALAQDGATLLELQALKSNLEQPDELLPLLVAESEGGGGSHVGSDPRYKLLSVFVHGASVFPTEEMAELWQDKIGDVVSVGDLNNIANALGAHYRNSGYFLTSVYPELRRVSAGGSGVELHLAVVEGYVDHVDIAAEQGTEPDRQRIESYLLPVVASRPLKVETLERALLLVNDMPGMTAKSVIRPSLSTPGAASVVVVTEQDPWSGDLFLTNRINPGYGPLRLGGDLTYNFASSQIGLSFAGARRFDGEPGGMEYLGLRYRMLVGPDGGAVDASVSGSRTHRSLSPLPGQTDGETLSGRLRFTYPFLRTRESSVFGFAELSGGHQSSKTLDVATMNETIWSAHVGLTGQLKGPGRTTQVTFEFAKGMDVFGASQPGDANLSRVDGRPDYMLFSGELSHLQNLGNDFLGRVTAAFQYSPDALLSGQEFALGGSRFGRGYVDEQMFGDSGLAMGVELSRPIDFEGKQFVPYAYLDGGWVWKHGTDAQSLVSAGLGVRAQFENDVSADLSLNRPVGAGGLDADGSSWLAVASVGWHF